MICRLLLRLVLASPLFYSALILASEPEYMTGNELYEYLGDWKKSAGQTPDAIDALKGGFGFGYVMGIASSMDRIYEPTLKTRFCTPDHVKRSQLFDVAYQYIESHPEYRQYSANGMVELAFSKAFPCK